MKKRLIALLLITLLAVAVVIPVQAASASLNNFRVRNTYTTGQFADVDGSAWYAIAVQACYEYGLMGGVSSGTFQPGGELSVAEAIKLTDTLSRIYATGKAGALYGTPWYQPYVDDALKRGIISSRPDDYDAPVTRAQFAGMIANALPAAAYPATNQVLDDAIPDVLVSDSFGPSVYTLYKAGILTGSDKFGTFLPFQSLSRAEAAAIIARAADMNFRKSITLPRALTGAELFEKSSPAVFYLERYDSEGVLLGIGSGFFITRDGLAVTNYHVIGGASSATIWTADGTEYAVKGICGYDTTMDIAVIQIDGSGFSYLPVTDSDALKVGTQVYAIGSPFGLVNTISDGIVSNEAQALNGSSFIQFSAPISMGSGGGPVLNTLGQVVGITCLTVLNGQTLNFAVPINDLNGLSRTGCVPLVSIVAENADSTVYYKNYLPVPDYGVFVGAPIYESSLDETANVKTYYYRLSDITVADEVAVDGYVTLLEHNGFQWHGSFTNHAGYKVDVYYYESFDMSVYFGTDNLDGVDCRFVAIY